MYCDYSPSFGQEKLTLENNSPPARTVVNPRRQVSMMYGVEFNSQVPLFQRTCSVIKECGLAQLSAEEIHAKTHSFLREIIQRTSQMRNLLSSFQ